MSVPSSTSRKKSSSPTFVLDVAHPPQHLSNVEQELMRAWSLVRNSSSLRVLKIIHGRGSRGKTAATKEFVRNWAFNNRDKFLQVIEGEHFGILDQQTQKMRMEVGQFPDGDLNNANPGITMIWVK